MAKSQPIKLLVCGDATGNLNQLFKKVSIVNQKNGPFDMLICIGEFFDPANDQEWLPYKNGKVAVPIPTYILGPTNLENRKFFPDLRGSELAENLIYLGPSGIYPCSNGLKIAYLSGLERDKVSSNNIGSEFDLESIRSIELAAGNKPMIDILLTSEWPCGVFDYAKVPEELKSKSVGSSLVSRLAYKLKPRYHFAGLQNIHYERLPYRNHEVLKEAAHHVTRFISLGDVGNSKKLKWLYAINTVPICHLESSELMKQPADVTECPYQSNIVSETDKRFSKKKGNSFKTNQFFYDTDAPADTGNNQGRKRHHDDSQSTGQKRPPKPTGPCWFCLASPEVEKHLVISVGTHSYLALAKGGLLPDHLLILPIEHFQSTSDIEQECRSEIEKFKTCLKNMFEKDSKVVVFFERNYKTQHMQVQAVPLPNSFFTHIKETFLDVSEACGINLDEVPKHSDIAQMAPPGTPFFYTELPDGKKLYHRIRKGFPLQFGREVLASQPLLNILDKVDWRECKIPKSEEISRRDEVRRRFKPFDFTLEDKSSSEDSSDED